MHSLLISLLLLSVGIGAPQTFDESQAFASARDLFKQGQFQKAAAAYRAIIDQDKSSAPAYAGLVQSYLKSDDVTAAEEASGRALADLPQSALIHAIRGDVYFREGLLYKAESEYRQAMKLDGKCARAWLGQGKIEAIVGRNPQSSKSFERAHDLDDDDEEIRFRWAVAQVYPHNVEALKKYLSEFRSDPEDERRRREFLELIKGIADRKIWLADKEATHIQMKFEPIIPSAGVFVGYGVPITLNGTVNMTALVDTGSSWLTITKTLADKSGARKISDQLAEGTDSLSQGYFAWIDRVNIGGIEFRSCVVHVLSIPHIEGADGLLGTEVLNHNLVTLDFPRRQLVLDPLPRLPDGDSQSSEPLVHPLSTPAAEATQMFTFGHLPLVFTNVDHKANGLMVLDTGANTSFISPEMAQETGKVLHNNAHWPIRSSTTENVVLEFSAIPRSGQNLVVTDLHSLSKRMGTEISGMIGISTLRSMTVTINYRDGVVEFKESK